MAKKKAKLASKEASGRIASFVNRYSNPSTAAGYKGAIESFIRCMCKLEKLDKTGHKIMHDYEQLFSDYCDEYKGKRDKIDQTHDTVKREELTASYNASLTLDFSTFARCLATECKSKQSARQIMTYARKLLEVNGIIVPEEEVMHLKRELKGGRANVDQDITGEMICRIVSGADVRGRAIVLTLAASGLRHNELLSLKLEKKTDDDSYIDMNHKPAKIYISAKDSKNKEPRFTFITTEAKKALAEWLKVRDEYIKTAAKHTQNLKASGNIEEAPDNSSDPRIFPYSDNAINSMWVTLLNRANLYTDKKTRNPYRIHGLRKFFISAVSYAGKKSLAEYLAGHTGYLDASYRQAPATAAPDYKKIESVLRCCIETDVKEELTTQKAELSTLRESTAVTKDAYMAMKATNERLEMQVQRMEEQMQAMERQQARLAKVVERYLTEAPPAPLDSPMADEE